MSEDGDSWLKSAFGLDIEQLLPKFDAQAPALAGPPPAGMAAAEEFLVAAQAAAPQVARAAPVVAAAAAGGGAAGAALAAGFVIGAVGPAIVGYVQAHAEELDEQGGADRGLPAGGLGPDFSPDGGVLDPGSVGPELEPDVTLPYRPTEPTPAFDPTIPAPSDPAPQDPAPDFTNPEIPPPPRVPQFSPDELELSEPVAPSEAPAEAPSEK